MATDKTWVTICLSIYPQDRQKADELCKQLTERYKERVTMSELFRLAIDQFDIDSVVHRRKSNGRKR